MEGLVIEALRETNKSRGEVIEELINDIRELSARVAGLEKGRIRLVQIIRRREYMIDRLLVKEMKKE